MRCHGGCSVHRCAAQAHGQDTGEADTGGGVEGTPPRVVLWSRATAEEIVAVLAENAETGVLAPAEAAGLIDRVWQRAGP